MSVISPNSQFHTSSFLQSQNEENSEQLFALYADAPNAVDAVRAGSFPQPGNFEPGIKFDAAKSGVAGREVVG